MVRLASTLLTILPTTVALLLANLVSAQTAPTLLDSEVLQAKRDAKVYIVQMSDDPVVAFNGDNSVMQATRVAPGQRLNTNAGHVQNYRSHLARQHDLLLGRINGGKAGGGKIYDYAYSFNGFAAKLTKTQVAQLRADPQVLAIWEDKLLHLETDSTPQFLDLTGRKGPWRAGLTGEDLIIGVIDTGIWPEHPSFADVPTAKYGDMGPKIPYGPPPAHWSGDVCDFGNSTFNPLDEPFECNNKLLGARYYVEGITEAGLLPNEFLSARDNDGHGSHTASTAAGNGRVNAEIGGEKLGKVSGMAPRARIAVYKACWNGSNPEVTLRGCFSSDTMAAIDQAVADGVDVINYSIGGESTIFNGADDMAFLFAADAGVFVATSQGNEGPDPQTTGTPSGVPWITAVGALADNNVFNPGLDVTSSAPGISALYEVVEATISPTLDGVGMLSSALVVADDGAGNSLDGCEPLINSTAVAGNIAMIQRGGCAFSLKFLNAQAAGAIALVVFNNAGDPITMGGDATGITIPGVMISQADGELIATALLGGDTAAGTLLDNAVPKEDSTAVFSSRGPNGGAPDIIKPDISAPGVNILAAQTPIPNDGQTPDELFQIISGTSMASPHIAGIGALVKQAHPDWSPAMIRSALMTTADPFLLKSYGEIPADPFDVGAGKVRAPLAFNPGLVYDANILDYVQFLCGSTTQPQILSPATCDASGSIDSSDLNLPSIGIAELLGSQTITRTVTNVASKPGRHNFFGKFFGNSFGNNKVLFKGTVVHMPEGVSASISPKYLYLAPGESADYTVTFNVEDDATYDQFAFGRLAWHGLVAGDGRHDFFDIVNVSSPIAVRPVKLEFPNLFSVDSAAVSDVASYGVKVGYSGAFNAAAGGLNAPEIQADSVGIGEATLHFFVVPPGTRVAEFSLFDESVGDGSGVDDLDLQIQGPDTAGFPLVDVSETPTSEEDVTLIDPEPGVYAAFVIHFATANPVTDYDLHFWSAGSNLGNFTATSNPSVSIGATESIDLNWNGLAAGTKYRGFVTYADEDSELGMTLIKVDTIP